MLRPFPLLRAYHQLYYRRAARTSIKRFSSTPFRKSFALYDPEEEDGLRVTAAMPKPGLMFVTSKIFDESKLSDAKYNEFYDKEHLPDVLGYKKSPVALRYKNTNKESPRGPYLALYPLEDVDFLLGDGLKKMVEETKNSKVIGGDMYEYIEFGLRPYELIQTFEGQGFENTSGKDRGKTLVCVAMAPAEGTDSEFDEWYRKQVCPAISIVHISAV